MSGPENIDEALSLLIETATRNGENALGFARDELVRFALDQSASDTKEAAKLLGVSLSTFKKWSSSVTDV
jgi:hypothetical protein